MQTYQHIKQQVLHPDGRIRLVVENKQVDQDGIEVSSTSEVLEFNRGDDVSNQSKHVKLVCSRAWNTI